MATRLPQSTLGGDLPPIAASLKSIFQSDCLKSLNWAILSSCLIDFPIALKERVLPIGYMALQVHHAAVLGPHCSLSPPFILWLPWSHRPSKVLPECSIISNTFSSAWCSSRPSAISPCVLKEAASSWLGELGHTFPQHLVPLQQHSVAPVTIVLSVWLLSYVLTSHLNCHEDNEHMALFAVVLSSFHGHPLTKVLQERLCTE